MKYLTESDPIAALQDSLPRWTEALRRIAAAPLEFCPSFREITTRWEAWWRCDNDRPILLAEAQRADAEPATRFDKLFDLLEKPEAWLDAREAQLQAMRPSCDRIPQIRVDISPVAPAAFMGSPLGLNRETNTGWLEPIVDDWETALPLRLDPHNRWYRKVLELTALLADRARGRYLVCTPDLSGPTDIIAALRGSERLCLDLMENRYAVRAASECALDGWAAAYTVLHDRVLSRSAGTIQWLNIWSSSPYTIPTCDFNALIGPTAFGELCLPFYEQQARAVGRVAFHLDGPDAARHARALAESPDITAVQYTPGTGTPSALAATGMLRMLQAHGKPILIHAPPDELARLVDQLDHRGLAIDAGSVPDEAALDELERQVGAT